MFSFDVVRRYATNDKFDEYMLNTAKSERDGPKLWGIPENQKQIDNKTVSGNFRVITNNCAFTVVMSSLYFTRSCVRVIYFVYRYENKTPFENDKLACNRFGRVLDVCI